MTIVYSPNKDPSQGMIFDMLIGKVEGSGVALIYKKGHFHFENIVPTHEIT